MNKGYGDEIFRKIKETPISKIIALRLDVIRTSTTELTTICPFHNDKSTGNFMISDQKGIFKCFVCGVGGNGIKFISLYDKISHKQAFFKVAYELGIISAEEYSRNSSKGISDAQFREIMVNSKEYKKEENPKADNETLDKIYSMFANGLEYLGKSKLSEKHLKHLKEDRKLTDEEIEKSGYFTYPSKYIFKKFLNDLEDNDIPIETLRHIPGFYYDLQKENYDFVSFRNGCISIPIKNEFNQIVAIQVRKDDVKKNKYTWMSSSFIYTKLDTTKEYGSSPGSPVHIERPNANKKISSSLFLTEGKFKAECLAKEFNSIALSVQGVTTWKNTVSKVINNLNKEFNNKFKHIYMTFDADMALNDQVFLQAILCGKEIEKNTKLDVLYSIWDFEDGKGIDDLINNGNKNNLDKIYLRDIEKLYYIYKIVLDKEIDLTLAEMDSKNIEELEKLSKDIDISKVSKEDKQEVFMQIIFPACENKKFK